MKKFCFKMENIKAILGFIIGFTFGIIIPWREIGFYLDADIVVAIVAVLISIITFLVQKKMTEQSVLPYITFNLVDLEDRIAINVENNGVGVAIIEEIKIYNKGCLCGTASLAEEINKISMNGKTCFENSIWKRYDNLKAIAPSQKKVMLELKSRDKEIIKDLREILKNMEIYISYKSIHEEKQHEIKQNLKYVGR